MIRLLIPSARVLINGNCDEYEWRECIRIYGQHHVRSLDTVDSQTMKRYMIGIGHTYTVNNNYIYVDERMLPQILIARKCHLDKIQRIFPSYDVYLDWSVKDDKDDQIVSSYLLSGQVTTKVDFISPIGVINGLDWEQTAKEAVPEYFSAFRDVSTYHNDNCRVPMHRPASQLEHLTMASERAASLRTSRIVQLCDVALAVTLMQALLMHRYGKCAWAQVGWMPSPCSTTTEYDGPLSSLVDRLSESYALY